MAAKKIKVYLAQPMTGLSAKAVYERSENAKRECYRFGFIPLCPVTEEQIKPSLKTINAGMQGLKEFWPRDKELLRQADCLLDLYADRKSDGVYWELGYMKYALHKPTIRIYNDGIPKVAVSLLEINKAVTSLFEALKWIQKNVKRRYSC